MRLSAALRSFYYLVKESYRMKKVNKVLLPLCYVGIGVVLLVVLWEVASRNFFNAPTQWSVEVATLGQALLACLGAAYVLQEEAHISVDFVTERLSEKQRDWVFCIESIIGFFLVAFFTFQLFKDGLWSMHINKVTDNALLPIFPFQLICTIGLAIMAVQFIIRSRKYYLQTKLPLRVKKDNENAGG